MGNEERDKHEEIMQKHQDELFSNFLAQADSLAIGKSLEDLNCHFDGNRPSNLIFAKSLSAQNIGKILAIYEHRIAVLGFLYGINPFDQMGVQLGKIAAKRIEKILRNENNDEFINSS